MAPPAAVAPCGAMVLAVTVGAWKSMLALAAPDPAPGRCHVADAVVTPARNTTRSTRGRRGGSMPLRRAGVGTAPSACGPGGQGDPGTPPPAGDCRAPGPPRGEPAGD